MYNYDDIGDNTYCYESIMGNECETGDGKHSVSIVTSSSANTKADSG